jgi:hypothetical protein
VPPDKVNHEGFPDTEYVSTSALSSELAISGSLNNALTSNVNTLSSAVVLALASLDATGASFAFVTVIVKGAADTVVPAASVAVTVVT